MARSPTRPLISDVRDERLAIYDGDDQPIELKIDLDKGVLN